MQNRLFHKEEKNTNNNNVSLTEAQNHFFKFAIEGITGNIKWMLKKRLSLAPEFKEQINNHDIAISCHKKRVQGLKKMLNGEKITQDDADLLLKMEEFQPYKSLITSKIEITHTEKPEPPKP